MKHVVHMNDVHVSSYANLVLLQKTYSALESKRWHKARRAFLKEESSKGALTCFYCKRSGLKVKTTRRIDQATVDHYIPKSEGGDPFSASNFVVCCNTCNHRKSSMHPEKFMSSDYIKKKKS